MRLMEFRLAQMVGRLDVDQLMRETPSSLFVEWVAFLEIEPLPSVRICDYIRQLTVYFLKVNKQKHDMDDLIIRYGETPAERMKRRAAKFTKKMMGLVRRNRAKHPVTKG